MAKKLTAAAVEKARPQRNQKGELVRTEIPDAGKPGLYLVIQPSGKRAWAIRYRYKGQPRKLTLNGFPSLKLAHKLAQGELDKVAEGRDPAAEKKAAKRAKLEEEKGDDLFRTVAENFFERYVKRENRESSQREIRRILDKEVLPRWSDKRIDEVTGRDLIALLDKIVDRGGGLTANRTFALVRKLFNWAISRKIISTSPAAGVKAPIPEVERDRVLTEQEIRWFWKACEQVGYPFGSWAEMLLLTGQRRTEVAGMRHSELNLKTRIWCIPGERTKNGEPHLVPLSDAALAIVQAHTPISGGYAFTSRGDAHIKAYSQAKAEIDRAMLAVAREEAERRGEDPETVQIPRWTFHDLRRTCATGMQKLGVDVPVVEKALNHTSGYFAGIVGTYQVDELAYEKEDAFDAWARYVELVVDEKLHVAHHAALNDGDKEERRRARATFREVIHRGGGQWQRYLETLRGHPKLEQVA